jgi:hypothetical protein
VHHQQVGSGEERKLPGATQDTCQLRPQVRSRRGERAEGERDTEPQVAFSSGFGGAEEARHPDHQQARGNGLLGTEAQYLDEDRHREYGAVPT